MEQSNVPHVVILPFPAQGHIKPMLSLAELLSHAGFQITFVNSDHNHARLLRSIDVQSFYSRWPRFRFESVTDGLPPEHPRTGGLSDLFTSTRIETKPVFRELLIKLGKENGRWMPPTCVIADGVMSFAIDVAEELQIPVISFRTDNACCTWVYFHIPKLIEEGNVPIQEDEHMDRPITSIPGFESLLRHRDLPSICRIEEAQSPIVQFFLTQTLAMTRASALILNTFQQLESPIISPLSSLFPKIYTVGPLHTLFNSRTNHSTPSISSDGGLWKQDRSCMTWLDSQPSKSVLYVSFGSLVTLTRNQLLEFWYGLINSKKPFLWVIRPESIAGEDDNVGQIPVEIVEGMKEKGCCIVEWAPQEEILAHQAIGGFLTHSGWNSTLESIVAGVPMICWPQLADQQVNSRCVGELWKIGLDMKDRCERLTVEMMVRELMEGGKREEMMRCVDEIKGMACESIKEGGSSYCNLENLIDDIRSMCSTSLAANSNQSSI